MSTCWIIAGTNGAGKAIFALEYPPTEAHCRRFVNADLLAAGLSPIDDSCVTLSRTGTGEEYGAGAERDWPAIQNTLEA